MLITISGYGGEVTLGSVTREQYVYYKLNDNETDVHNMLMGYPEDCEQEYSSDLELGTFYDMDNIAHGNGATFEAAYITVTNDDGDIIWEGEPAVLATKPEGANLIVEEEEYYFEDSGHDYGIYCYSAEKGVFTEILVTGVDKFDPSKLRMHIDDIEGNRIISGIEYKGYDAEETGEYSTSGKSFDYVWLTNVATD